MADTPYLTGHIMSDLACPLYPQKRTCAVQKGMSALGQKQTWTATAFRLAAVSVKRVVRTYRHIKTGWYSARRVAHLGMAAAWNGHAADDGASNLWRCSSGGLRVTAVVARGRGGPHQHGKDKRRNKRGGCFPPGPRLCARPANLLLSDKFPPAQWVQCILYSYRELSFANMEATKFICWRPLWVTCGRRLGKNFLTLLQHLVGCGHVSGLFVRRIWPLALMLCADRVPIESTHFKVR